MDLTSEQIKKQLKTGYNSPSVARISLAVSLLVFSFSCYLQFKTALPQGLSETRHTTPPPPSKPVANIAGLHLFGVAPAANTRDAPITTLALTLHGILAAGGENIGTAIISSSQSPEKVYNVGDSIQGQVILIHVYPDRVILARGKRLETLYLPHHVTSAH